MCGDQTLIGPITRRLLCPALVALSWLLWARANSDQDMPREARRCLPTKVIGDSTCGLRCSSLEKHIASVYRGQIRLKVARASWRARWRIKRYSRSMYRLGEFPQSYLATVASEESDRRNMSFQAKRLKMPMLPIISYRVRAWESWQVAFNE